MRLTVKVSKSHQIALPSAARKQLGIKPGDRLLVDIQDGLIVLLPQPDDYVAAMSGLHHDIWQDNADTPTYLDDSTDALS